MLVFKRSFFTLLELLVVMTILSLCVVLTGIKLTQAWSEQRFYSETQQILNHLQMAQDLMLIQDTDVKLKIVQKRDKTLWFWLEVEKPLVVRVPRDLNYPLGINKERSIKWMELIQRQTQLHGIKFFDLIGSDNRSLVVQEEIPSDVEKMQVIQFSLGRMSKGTLILKNANSDDKEVKSQDIFLVGYPCSIRNQKKLIPEEERMRETHVLYPQFPKDDS